MVILHVNMADRRKPKRRSDKEEQTCTKEEYAVAKHLRFNTMAHEGRLAGMTVKCFIASDAVNCLLDSKWAKGKAGSDSEISFTDRKSCVAFLNRFIAKGLFHRADKVLRNKDKDKKKKKKEIDEKEKENVTDDKLSKKDKKSKKEKEKIEETEAESKKDEKKADKTSKPKKYKLSMSEDQRFVDGNSIYVWIYDPIHPKTFVIGFFMLLGAAALCLFPLWPDWMRIAVYYTSLLGASFVGFMLVLIVLRVIIFSIIWILTLGKHHIWIFPNLTEDVGIIDSFKPFIKHDVYPPPELAADIEKVKTLKKKKTRKDGKDEVQEDSERDNEGEEETENERTDDGFEILKTNNEEEEDSIEEGEEEEQTEEESNVDEGK